MEYLRRGEPEKYMQHRPVATGDIHIDIQEKKIRGGLRRTFILHTSEPLLMKIFRVNISHEYMNDDRIFCNGFQSWTESREYKTTEKIHKLRSLARLVKLNRMGDYDFISTLTAAPLFSYVYTTVRDADGDTHLIASLDESKGYTIIGHHPDDQRLEIVKDIEGRTVQGTIPLLSLYFAEGPVDKVMTQWKKELQLTLTPPRVAGWTSWYNYYTGISHEIINDNIQAFRENAIPIDIFQVDDGWQSAVGDWLSVRKEFPGGMKEVARSIHDAGYRAGLWLAPFVCDSRSEIFHTRKKWLLKDEKGKPVPAGWIPLWKGNFYALDIYCEEVRDYLTRVFETVLTRWDFDMVKLDFLYAAAMIPRHGKSRGEIMYEGMEFLRELVGKKLILGCGVPLGPAMHTTDYCRIGSDIGLSWEDRLLKGVRYRERVSTVNSLSSTVGRYLLDGIGFGNDPDVFLLRDDNIKMNITERRTLFRLNAALGSLLFTSDNLRRYSPAQMKEYRSLFPLPDITRRHAENQEGLVTVNLDTPRGEFSIAANLSDTTRSVTLPFDSFRGDAVTDTWHTGRAGEEVTLEPHASEVFRRMDSGTCRLLGSTGHLFPGADVAALSCKGKKVTIKGPQQGTVVLAVQKEGTYSVNGESIEAEMYDGEYIIEYHISVTKENEERK